MPTLEVAVPEGCLPGDEFTVEWEGTHLAVRVPEDGYAGMLLAVDIQPTEEVEVMIPEGCFAGDEVKVSHEGTTFFVSIPEGLGPGDKILVRRPKIELENHLLDLEALQLEDAEEVIEEHLAAPAKGAEKQGAAASPSRGERRERSTAANLGTVGSGVASGAGAEGEGLSSAGAEGKGLSLSLSIFGGFTLSLAVQTAPKWPIGSTMEVYRTDGEWSRCIIKEYDWRGVTYTVQLTDLRMKYFVEEEDLRMPGSGYL
jgi:hypothetical protein